MPARPHRALDKLSWDHCPKAGEAAMRRGAHQRTKGWTRESWIKGIVSGGRGGWVRGTLTAEVQVQTERVPPTNQGVGKTFYPGGASAIHAGRSPSLGNGPLIGAQLLSESSGLALNHQKRPRWRQQRLKALSRIARAEIVPAQFLEELLVAMHDAVSALDARLAGETPAPLAHHLKSSRGPLGFWVAWDTSMVGPTPLVGNQGRMTVGIVQPAVADGAGQRDFGCP